MVLDWNSHSIAVIIPSFVHARRRFSMRIGLTVQDKGLQAEAVEFDNERMAAKES